MDEQSHLLIRYRCTVKNVTSLGPNNISRQRHTLSQSEAELGQLGFEETCTPESRITDGDSPTVPGLARLVV